MADRHELPKGPGPVPEQYQAIIMQIAREIGGHCRQLLPLLEEIGAKNIALVEGELHLVISKATPEQKALSDNWGNA